MSSLISSLGIDRLSLADRAQLVEEILDSLECDREPPALSVTAIRCQRPGRAWQNTCSRPSTCSGWGNRSSGAKSTPDVPMDSVSTPGLTAFRPTAAAATRPRESR